MKRKDINPGDLLAYYQGRDPEYYVHPYIVLSTDLYARDRYRHTLKLALPRERMRSGGWGKNTVGMLAVRLNDTADAARVRELATVEIARVALDYSTDVSTSVKDGDTEVGRYDLVTSLAYLHGSYAEWQERFAKREAANKARNAEKEARDEADRITYDGLNERLEALGITGYARANWETKYRFDGLTFEDMAELVELAERGMQSVPNIT